jgi:O-antigen/teichoic acid export membrane protein
MHPRKFVRDSVGYAFAQYTVRAALMLRGLIAARFLGPGAYGAWNAIQIMIDYGPLASAGTQSGLDQMVPPRIVAGEPAALERTKRAALFNITALTGMFVLACMTGLVFGHSRMLHSWGFLGVGAAMVCAMSVNLAYYQTSIMRSHGDITTASGWMMFQGAVGGALGLALLPWLHAWGLLLGWTIGCLAAFVYSSVRSRRFAPLLPRPAAESFDLVQVGFPMFVFTASTQIMRNLDRLIILSYVSTEALGYYSLSVMALTFLMYMPDSIAYVIYPRLLREYGQSGQDPESIRPQVERVLQLFSVLVPPLCALAYLSSQPAVGLLLPKFLPGVGALRVLCFGAAALAFSNLSSIVLMTVGRQLMLMPAALFGVGLYAALDLLAVKSGHGIVGVAWGTLTAYAVSSGVLLAMMFWSLGLRAGRAASLLARLYAPLLLALGLATALEHYMPWAGRPQLAWTALRLVANLAAFSLVYFSAVYPLTRGMGLLHVLSEVDIPVLGPILRRLHRGGGEGDAS